MKLNEALQKAYQEFQQEQEENRAAIKARHEKKITEWLHNNDIDGTMVVDNTVITDDITLRFEFRRPNGDISSVSVKGKCPNCNKPCWSGPIYKGTSPLHEIEVMRRNFYPDYNHNCPARTPQDAFWDAFQSAVEEIIESRGE